MIEYETKNQLIALGNDVLVTRCRAWGAVDHCKFLKSTTKVGCSLFVDYSSSKCNTIFSGCNFDLEFGNTIHAEVAALTAYVNSSKNNKKIQFIYIYAKRDGQYCVENFTPCGACIDALRTYTGENTKIYTDNGKIVREYTLKELMPHYPTR